MSFLARNPAESGSGLTSLEKNSKRMLCAFFSSVDRCLLQLQITSSGVDYVAHDMALKKYGFKKTLKN